MDKQTTEGGLEGGMESEMKLSSPYLSLPYLLCTIRTIPVALLLKWVILSHVKIKHASRRHHLKKKAGIELTFPTYMTYNVAKVSKL